MVINKLVYPIFLKCCKFSHDNFWKFILEDLAYGNCPYGTYIVKNYLCCNYKGKEFSYKIDSKKKPDIVYSEIYDILTHITFLNIESQIWRIRAVGISIPPQLSAVQLLSRNPPARVHWIK